MSQSFFHLTPDNDPHQASSRGSLSYCAGEECATYTEEEHATLMAEANVLTEAFFSAINTYSEAHPELSYDVILHAIDCLAYCVNRQMDEAVADA